MRIGRTLILAIAVEALAIFALVLLVAVLGPSDPSAAQAYAERLGNWVGPIAGSVLCIGGGWLAARGLSTRHILHGLLLGALVAAIDIALLVAADAGLQALFVFSNVGRLAGGSLGGWWASRGR